MTDEDVLELQIPPEAEFVATARLFLAAAGRHFEMSEEAVADAKVAVSEVCADAIEDSRHADPLKIVVRPALEALEVEVSSIESGIEPDLALQPGIPPEAAVNQERTFREPLVRALFPEASYDPDSHNLRLAMPWEMPEDPEDP